MLDLEHSINLKPLTRQYKFFDLTRTFNKKNAIYSALIVLIVMTLCLFLIINSKGDVPTKTTNTIVTFAIIIGVAALGIYGKAQRAKVYIKLSNFAKENNLTYKSNIDSTKLPGLIFNIGRNNNIIDRVTLSVDPKIDIGNYSYITGAGRSKTIHQFGYIEVTLPNTLPQMVLDATKNNLMDGRISSIPKSFNREQKISLEGNFDKYFALYAPDKFKQDAFYIFTPDVMEAFINNASNFDVEIIDNKMYFYQSTIFNFTDVATFKDVLPKIDILVNEVMKQASNYSVKLGHDKNKDLDGEESSSNSLSNEPSVVVAESSRQPGYYLKSRRLWSLKTIITVIGAIVAIAYLVSALFNA